MHDLPRVRLALLPTPLHRLERLSEALGGPQLWIKRDDLTGFGGGGNKVRKLEYSFGDALQRGAKSVITAGGVQSNHTRQTAAAAAHLGLKCVIALAGTEPKVITGNLLLDQLFGAEVIWAGSRSLMEVMADSASRMRAEGLDPYIIPVGASNEIGAIGYAEAFLEMETQSRALGQSFDRIVFAAGSGGTQAGLMSGAASVGYQGHIVGVRVAKMGPEADSRVQDLIKKTTERWTGKQWIGACPVEVWDGYAEPGYAVMGQPDREAIRLTARTEGILLDPVYTGRAMAGLIDKIRRQEIDRDERVLFWHTGGSPALFAYANELM